MPLKELLKNYHIKTGIDKLEELPAESVMLRKEKKRLKILFDPVIEPQPNDLNNLEQIVPQIVNHFKNDYYIKVIGDPKLNIIAFKSKVINIYALSSSLTDKGWHLNILQNPASFHFCITNLHVQNETLTDTEEFPNFDC